MMDIDPLDALLPQLQKEDGRLWMRILAETYWQYNEIAFWVLVKDQAQIAKAFPFLQKALTPLRSERVLKVTVAFLSLTKVQRLDYGMLQSEAFFAPNAIDYLNEEPIENYRIPEVFDRVYPDDPYAIVRKECSMDCDPLTRLLPELQREDGRLWMRILAETHWHYGEIPFWVLVKDQAQIAEALPFLQEALAPLRSEPDAKVTVAFLSKTRVRELHYGMLEGDAFFAPNALDFYNEEPIETHRTASVFDSAYPDDPYAIVDGEWLEARRRMALRPDETP